MALQDDLQILQRKDLYFLIVGDDVEIISAKYGRQSLSRCTLNMFTT